MLEPSDRILVAVSGGKDSLALWDILLELGYRADGLYLGLGIGEYSERSHRIARAFAGRTRRAPRRRRPRATTTGSTSRPPARRARGRRARCAGCPSATCSTARRSSTGSTWSRPATTWTTRPRRCSATRCGGRPTTSRASPRCCRRRRGWRSKVKPLYRLSELETAAFAFLRGIDYVVEECPLVGGNTQLRYKDAMNQLESTSPGTKAQFLLRLPGPGGAAVRDAGRRSSSSGASDAASPRPAGSARSAAPGRRSWASGSERAAASAMNEASRAIARRPSRCPTRSCRPRSTADADAVR